MNSFKYSLGPLGFLLTSALVIGTGCGDDSGALPDMGVVHNPVYRDAGALDSVFVFFDGSIRTDTSSPPWDGSLPQEDGAVADDGSHPVCATPPCPLGGGCRNPADCESGFCVEQTCVDACHNQLTDGDETDVDCGGSCDSCATGLKCVQPQDCVTGFCPATLCVGACHNEVKDGDETDVDCGGSCALCVNDKACGDADDCRSGFCVAKVCSGPCGNEIKDGDETDVDCGGTCTTKCEHLKACVNNSDCTTDRCEQLVCKNCSTPLPGLSGGASGHSIRGVSGQGSSLRISYHDGDRYTSRSITLAPFTASGGCSGDQAIKMISASGNRLAITCTDSEGRGRVSYVTLSSATASGKACSASDEYVAGLSGSGSTLRVGCFDGDRRPSTDTITFTGVEVCN